MLALEPKWQAKAIVAKKGPSVRQLLRDLILAPLPFWYNNHSQAVLLFCAVSVGAQVKKGQGQALPRYPGSQEHRQEARKVVHTHSRSDNSEGEDTSSVKNSLGVDSPGRRSQNRTISARVRTLPRLEIRDSLAS